MSSNAPQTPQTIPKQSSFYMQEVEGLCRVRSSSLKISREKLIEIRRRRGREIETRSKEDDINRSSCDEPSNEPESRGRSRSVVSRGRSVVLLVEVGLLLVLVVVLRSRSRRRVLLAMGVMVMSVGRSGS